MVDKKTTTTGPRPGDLNGQPKAVESKANKFRRLGNARLPKALKYIGALANLGNKSQYESTDTQREYIVKQLQAAVDEVKRCYSGGSAPIHASLIPE